MSAEITFPLEIEFRNLDRSEHLENRVRENVAKLNRYYDRIMSCRVVIEPGHSRHVKGNLYNVLIDVTVPTGELVASRGPQDNHAHEDPYVAVRDAFKAMQKQLRAFAAKQRGVVKHHEAPPQGRIIKLVPETGFGVILTADGREVDFSRNSVVGYDFDKLEGGESVRFSEVKGEYGPAAGTVHIEG
ncbi:MAG: HPF/RaiA family ribosome-associated protein [Halothiobacillaceae bacterium]